MNDQKKPNRKRERPLNIRTTDAIHARITAEAEASGLTLTQEVERRLQLTFLSDDRAVEMLLHDLAMQIAKANRLTGKDWTSDRLTAHVAKWLIGWTFNGHCAPREDFAAYAELCAASDRARDAQARATDDLLRGQFISHRTPTATLGAIFLAQGDAQAALPRGGGMFGANRVDNRTELQKTLDRLGYALTDEAQEAIRQYDNGDDLPAHIVQGINLLRDLPRIFNAAEYAESEVRVATGKDDELADQGLELAKAAAELELA